MVKNKVLRKWYLKISPRRYYNKLWDEIEHEFQKFLKTSPNKDNIAEEKSNRDYNQLVCRDDYNVYLSDKIIREAEKYDIPMPSRRPSGPKDYDPEGNWKKTVHHIFYLDENARNILKKRIREELKW